VGDVNELSDRVRDGRNRLGRLEREIRANLDAKDRAVNEETKKQDRRREQDRRELIDYIQRLERQLDDARRWADRHEQQMQRLRREIY
jgi:chromosome segregation ATPase